MLCTAHRHARLGSMVLLVAGALGLGCSSAAPQTESNSNLDRLRERIDERRATVSASHENEPEDLAHDELLVGDAVEVTDRNLLLEPRYRGALPDNDPLVLGVYRLRTHRDPIIDGDTVAVQGLDASLRLVGIDAEEVWHGQDDLRERAYSDFDDYLRLIYAEAEGIPKFATPMGERAREFARQFFAGDTQVRLELDDTERTRGYFDRYLVYVFALRNGEWINYNVEAVRAGMSPYFMKYGYSARFHAEFVEAQDEARAEQRGIWDPTLPHYPDYDERLEWWTRRADAIEHFRSRYGRRAEFVEVALGSEFERLRQMNGQSVTVFGVISDIHADYNPQRVTLSHKIGEDFQMVAFDAGVLESYQLEQYLGEYIYVRGRLNLYRGDPQFILDDGVEIWTEP